MSKALCSPALPDITATASSPHTELYFEALRYSASQRRHILTSHPSLKQPRVEHVLLLLFTWLKTAGHLIRCLSDFLSRMCRVRGNIAPLRPLLPDCCSVSGLHCCPTSECMNSNRRPALGRLLAGTPPPFHLDHHPHSRRRRSFHRDFDGLTWLVGTPFQHCQIVDYLANHALFTMFRSFGLLGLI